MPHQNVESSMATAQNAAADPAQPNDQARGQDVSANREPRSYVAADEADASQAPPGAGEVGDYMDEGEPLAADDMQQGGTNANRPDRTEKLDQQGPKTQAANRDIVSNRGDIGR